MTTLTRFLFVLCYASVTQATLVKIDSFILSDNRELYILSDNHALANAQYEDAYQQLLKQELTALDQQNNATVTFLVEKPAQLTKFFTFTSRLTFDLDTLVQELNVKNSIVKDCEIRCFSGAAQLILRAANPATIFPALNYNAQDIFCCLKDITFEQVLQEWKQYYTFLSAQPHIVTCFTQKLQEARAHYKSLKASLRAYAQENILLYAKEHANRYTLAYDIYTALAPLFELFVLHTLLTTSSQKIIVLTGFLHAEELGRMACTLGARFQKTWGTSIHTYLDQNDFKDWITCLKN